MTDKPKCHDCGANPGELHDPGCDMEQCPECGGQWIQCGHIGTHDRIPWTGDWPREADAIELGFKRKDGTPDIERLICGFGCRWSPSLAKYIRT